jgi:hypothetical protein
MVTSMKNRSVALQYSDAHESPIESGNPAGTDRLKRHERMDLCNNFRGHNRPSNVEMLAGVVSPSLNKLEGEVRAMRDNGTQPYVLLSDRTCDGRRLVFLIKDDGTWFG